MNYIKICPRCGNNETGDFSFCSRCGSPLSIPAQPATPPQTFGAAQPVNPAPPQGYTPQQPVAPAQNYISQQPVAHAQGFSHAPGYTSSQGYTPSAPVKTGSSSTGLKAMGIIGVAIFAISFFLITSTNWLFHLVNNERIYYTLCITEHIGRILIFFSLALMMDGKKSVPTQNAPNTSEHKTDGAYRVLTLVGATLQIPLIFNWIFDIFGIYLQGVNPLLQFLSGAGYVLFFIGVILYIANKRKKQ